MSRVEEMQAELRVLEAFNDTTRATILRSMLEYEIAAEEKSHVNGRGSLDLDWKDYEGVIGQDPITHKWEATTKQTTALV